MQSQNVETEMDTHYISIGGVARQDTLSIHLSQYVLLSVFFRFIFSISISKTFRLKQYLNKKSL